MERSHLHRWITGLTLLPLLIYLVYRGGIYLAGFAAVVSLLAMGEYVRIALKDENGRWFGPLSLMALLSAPALVWMAHAGPPDLLLLLLFLNFFGCGLVVLAKFSAGPTVLERTARQAGGVTLIGLGLAFAVLIRDGSDGMAWLFLVLAVVFAGDIGAFYAGTRFGRHKLLPAVSPGKTVEGSLGGVCANLLVGAVGKAVALPAMDWTGSLLCFALLGVAGQIGDLYESAFKRAAGVKDSGGILPGHGGFLDRIDALLFALPVAYFFKKFILWV